MYINYICIYVYIHILIHGGGLNDDARQNKVVLGTCGVGCANGGGIGDSDIGGCCCLLRG